MENGLVSPADEGTPQGGPLSPLLSNIMLDEPDKELERRGRCFVRYADDCNIYVKTERAGQRVMESITTFIAKKLKLKVNEKKSAVGKPQERKFLGFSFTWGRGPNLRRQWKRGTTRYKELRKRGVPSYPAAVAAGAPRGPWRMARHATLQRALPNAYFDSLGLPRLVVRTA